MYHTMTLMTMTGVFVYIYFFIFLFQETLSRHDIINQSSLNQF